MNFDPHRRITSSMVVCTKLVQWVTAGGLFLLTWGVLVAQLTPVPLSSQIHEILLPVSRLTRTKWTAEYGVGSVVSCYFTRSSLCML